MRKVILQNSGNPPGADHKVVRLPKVCLYTGAGSRVINNFFPTHYTFLEATPCHHHLR